MISTVSFWGTSKCYCKRSCQSPKLKWIVLTFIKSSDKTDEHVRFVIVSRNTAQNILLVTTNEIQVHHFSNFCTVNGLPPGAFTGSWYRKASIPWLEWLGLQVWKSTFVAHFQTIFVNEYYGFSLFKFHCSLIPRFQLSRCQFPNHFSERIITLFSHAYMCHWVLMIQSYFRCSRRIRT